MAIATVTAGLKCAPDTTASVWMSTKRTKTCMRPITDQSTNGFGFACVATGPNRHTARLMNMTSMSVPMNSAI